MYTNVQRYVQWHTQIRTRICIHTPPLWQQCYVNIHRHTCKPHTHPPCHPHIYTNAILHPPSHTQTLPPTLLPTHTYQRTQEANDKVHLACVPSRNFSKISLIGISYCDLVVSWCFENFFRHTAARRYSILNIRYGVASISRLLKIIRLFCKRAL